MALRRLRFCFVTTFYPPHSCGGDGIYVYRLANELAERGHEVEVVHCLDSFRALSDGKTLSGFADHPNVRVHGLKSRLGVLSPVLTHLTGFPLLKRRALRGVLERPFDVIHYHNVSLVGGPRLLAWGSALKLYTMHEYWLCCPTHTLFRFNRQPCTRRYCTLCSLAYRRPPQLWRWSRLMQSSMRHVHGFLALSEFALSKHREAFPDIPLYRLPPFVPVSRTEFNGVPASAEGEPAGPYFLYVGRLEKLKGLQTIIPAFGKFEAAPLRVAGSGKMEAELRRLACGCNVEFLGQMPESRLSGLYRGAIALIVPSICHEILPLVILEAFREGTPVLARNMGGMPELINAGGGMTFETEAQLLEAMAKLSGDLRLRQEMGEKARKVFLERWTAASHIESYLDIVDLLSALHRREPGQ